MMPKIPALPLLLCGLLLASPVAAAQYDSAYTELDLDQCTVLGADDFGAQYACPGYKGIPMFVAEGDLRFMVSYGFGAPDAKAASQTLPPFNTVAPNIEWRVSNITGGWKPFATIVRYLLDDDENEPVKKRQVLVVTKISDKGTCQIAWVDAKANSDANELARKAADEKADSFDCAKDPEIVGKFEAWKR
ncbi:hypothetical protein [Paradevosia shaoguanensis]|uniref:Uncharacterized protein n=1 Tax=Paradevosia shaoguanensis TaxID=1335043 RepID=A0AA41UCG0_9HYPH|nr:hypothetical protein [Paradevosia shaoguanensis]MCF1743792.1 hypothetical protein [Paradevosia shaoguanensis]MCI0128275.1 hypothetical protein [Paradevosia shaoguanensis]